MTERGKRRWMLLLPVIVCALGIAGMSALWLREYRQSAFEKLSKFCEVLTEKNPEAEDQILLALKEYSALPEGESGGSRFLARYGYDAGRFSGGAQRRLLVFSAAAGLLMSGSFFACLWRLERQKNMRIAELTDYLEKINTGAEGTLIQTGEDDFSHLQDEMYKTVTHLYETREAAVRAKANFADNLANIAHQLKTPVTAASLSLQLMEKEGPNPRAGQVRRQLERLGSLEDALLTLSKIDTGILALERTDVDIYTALALAADHLSGLLHKTGVSVSVSDGGPVKIAGDMEWTMEALFNLMKNCMEHSPPGGTVHCAYSSNPLYTEISIWDEGEGFCREDIPRLFERFYRGKRAVGEGMGIGLPLAKFIFEQQNGTVAARNLPEGGACFEIRVYSH